MSARDLFALQALDLDCDAEREAIAGIEARLGPSEAVAAVQGELAAAKERLAATEKQLRDAEWQIEDLEVKIKALEQKLYGGTVRNPKELSGLQAETQQFQQQRAAADDLALRLMEEADALRVAIAALSARAKALEEEWRREQEALRAEQGQRQARLQSLEARRQTAASRISPSSLSLYEFLRPRKAGRAVARVEGGTCSGCRISLPMKDLQQARLGQESVQCSSCERILFVS